MPRFAVSLILCCACLFVWAEDWPMWRYDAARSGASPEQLDGKLNLQWTAEYPPLDPAWPDEARLTFDYAYEPIVVGKTLYFGSSYNDSLTALDTETGAERWRFYADGPVRFAPVAAGGKVYFVSDDGSLYCIDGETGALVWRFQGAPSDRKVLGNKRLVSVWPARGAPVVADGVVYFGAGIWNFEGVFLYAIDAETGTMLWSNDTADVPFINQPHNSPAFAGVSPQGYFAVSGDKLLVPSGRASAACFDRKTGALTYFRILDNNRHGGYHARVAGDYFFNPDSLYRVSDGQSLGNESAEVAIAGDLIYSIEKGRIKALDLAHMKVEEVKDKKNNVYWRHDMPMLWSVDGDATNLIAAGKQVFGCAPGRVFALDPPQSKGDAKVSWEATVEGAPLSLLTAGKRLFVTTREGRIYCFGEKKAQGEVLPRVPSIPASSDAKIAEQAKEILDKTGVTEGYALVIGADSPALLLELARQSKLHLAVIEPDTAKVAEARRMLDAAGVYGARVAVMPGDPAALKVSPYWASLCVCAESSNEAVLTRVFEVLRPFGGVACLALDSGGRAAAETLAKTVLGTPKVEQAGDWILVRREGALPGAANWTHQYADPANTVVSQDERVRAPLGVLWFGGSSNVDILPRHGHGPSEQIVDGRLFIEGPDVMRALDQYTGRVLWSTKLAGLGKPFDTTSHQPGANSRGSNFASAPDGIYVFQGTQCLRLDPATGETLSTFTLPTPEGASEPPVWSHVTLSDDLLVAGSGPIVVDEEIHGSSWDAISCKRIVVMNRHTGEALWSQTAKTAFRHNAIAVGGGKVFCIDSATDRLREKMERRGIAADKSGRLAAFDLRTGAEAWADTANVFGTWLGYSAKNDILLQAGRASRDMLDDEANDRMNAYRGADGKVLWDKSNRYSGPCMLLDDTIIAQEEAFDLLTGEKRMREHPLTGEPLEWRWTRNHGCNSAIASRNLVTFRSAAAGFFDMERGGGTGNLGGFRSGCTSNLIAAGGILNAPDYTRTCTCSYQNQTSLALVYSPDVEMWTFNHLTGGDARIRRLGLNFGAPGDRSADDGTLWLDWPSVGGPSPKVDVEIEPVNVTWFRHHSARMQDDGLKWVGASGGKGIETVRVKLDKEGKDTVKYTVRLFFAEPGSLNPTDRVFDVDIQGDKALKQFDIVQEAGGAMRTVAKEFKGVKVKDVLTVTLKASKAETILCGIEAVMEE